MGVSDVGSDNVGKRDEYLGAGIGFESGHFGFYGPCGVGCVSLASMGIGGVFHLVIGADQTRGSADLACAGFIGSGSSDCHGDRVLAGDF